MQITEDPMHLEHLGSQTEQISVAPVALLKYSLGQLTKHELFTEYK